MAALHLEPGEWLPITAAQLGNTGVRLTARVCWMPPSYTPPGYTSERSSFGCGGSADEGTSEAKRAAMAAAWGEAYGAEWRPDGEYDACLTERMFALEEMDDEFRMWQETYANDPIYSQLSTAAPPVKTVLPIYGINKPSLAGAIYRRKVTKFRQGQRTCYLKMDKDATVSHPGCAHAGSNGPLPFLPQFLFSFQPPLPLFSPPFVVPRREPVACAGRAVAS
jgi:hypothetical protein